MAWAFRERSGMRIVESKSLVSGDAKTVVRVKSGGGKDMPWVRKRFAAVDDEGKLVLTTGFLGKIMGIFSHEPEIVFTNDQENAKDVKRATQSRRWTRPWRTKAVEWTPDK